jgi:hypothetical protein
VRWCRLGRTPSMFDLRIREYSTVQVYFFVGSTEFMSLSRLRYCLSVLNRPVHDQSNTSLTAQQYAQAHPSSIFVGGISC